MKKIFNIKHSNFALVFLLTFVMLFSYPSIAYCSSDTSDVNTTPDGVTTIVSSSDVKGSTIAPSTNFLERYKKNINLTKGKYVYKPITFNNNEAFDAYVTYDGTQKDFEKTTKEVNKFKNLKITQDQLTEDTSYIEGTATFTINELQNAINGDVLYLYSNTYNIEDQVNVTNSQILSKVDQYNRIQQTKKDKNDENYNSLAIKKENELTADINMSLATLESLEKSVSTQSFRIDARDEASISNKQFKDYVSTTFNDSIEFSIVYIVVFAVLTFVYLIVRKTNGKDSKLIITIEKNSKLITRIVLIGSILAIVYMCFVAVVNQSRTYYYNDIYEETTTTAKDMSRDAVASDGSAVTSNTQLYGEQEKISRTANYNAETSDFDSDINKYNKILKNKYVKTLGYSLDTGTNSTLYSNILVESDKFDSTYDQISKIGTVINFDKSSSNLTDTISEEEQKLEKLKNEKESLVTAEKTATDYSVILELENQIADVSQQIYYTQQVLDANNNDVAYSEIYFTLNSKQSSLSIFNNGFFGDIFAFIIIIIHSLLLIVVSAFLPLIVTIFSYKTLKKVFNIKGKDKGKKTSRKDKKKKEKRDKEKANKVSVVNPINEPEVVLIEDESEVDEVKTEEDSKPVDSDTKETPTNNNDTIDKI